MFGLRPDGKKIKTIDPIMKLVPHIMPDRNDSMVMTQYDIDCRYMDEYIFAKRKEGIHYSYMDILMAAAARTLGLRPKLNRFIMNRRVFKRNNIQISFSVMKELTDEGEETIIKLTLNGTETIAQIGEMIAKEVAANTKVTTNNDTDKLAKFLTAIPNGVIKCVVGFLKFLDYHGMLPLSIINLSPFHTSLYLTNMRSIKMSSVFHHIYNFGTTSIFLAMGKEQNEPFVLDADTATMGSKKIMRLGAVIDERICDGLYFGNSLRQFKKLLEHPTLMETPLEQAIQDIK